MADRAGSDSACHSVEERLRHPR